MDWFKNGIFFFVPSVLWAGFGIGDVFTAETIVPYGALKTMILCGFSIVFLGLGCIHRTMIRQDDGS